MPSRPSRRQRLRLACVLALGVVAIGCNTFQGALLYRDGTRALDEGDPDAAIHALEEAVERVPDASEVRNHLGLAYLAADRPADALRAFERAVELDCDNQAAQQNLRHMRARSRAH